MKFDILSVIVALGLGAHGTLPETPLLEKYTQPPAEEFGNLMVTSCKVFEDRIEVTRHPMLHPGQWEVSTKTYRTFTRLKDVIQEVAQAPFVDYPGKQGAPLITYTAFSGQDPYHTPPTIIKMEGPFRRYNQSSNAKILINFLDEKCSSL